MARRDSREATQRAVRAGHLAPIVCATCGQRFWADEQKRAHYGTSSGRSYCQYAPAGPRP